MPDGMGAGGKGVLVQAPPPTPQGPIYLASHDLASQLDLGAKDSAARGSAPYPCARIRT
jgi:hypothetical protein